MEDNFNSDFKYTVPISGYYKILARMVQWIPTGGQELMPNPKRKWYQFWKPKMVLMSVYKNIIEDEGPEVKFLNQGEKVPPKFIITRL